MLFFALSKGGVAEFLNLRQENQDHQLWVSGGVLSHQEIDELRASGISVSVFAHEVHTEDSVAMGHAFDVIREHHPIVVIWSETQMS